MLEGPCNGLRDNLVKKEVRLVNKDEYCTSKECYQCGDLMNPDFLNMKMGCLQYQMVYYLVASAKCR